MKGENQKLKMILLLQILQEETDDAHGLTMAQLIEALQERGVHADRKTLYQDIAELNKLDEVDIEYERAGRNTAYHMGNRYFELPELKLLVDSVQAAKFITDQKSRTLIRKLEGFASRYEAKQLQRQVVIAGRVKSPNSRIYYSVDRIYTAIGQDRQVTFHYFQWDLEKKPVLRHGGALYHVSPWCLMWDNEYYYLVGFDGTDRKIKHYRVDKMRDLEVVDLPREGKGAFRDFDLARYSKSLFGMFGGEERLVTIEGSREIAPVFIDRFGKDIVMMPRGGDRFETRVEVVPSGQFFGWIFGLGNQVRITAPADVAASMRDWIRRAARLYEEEI